jgi:hypothetical protein
MITLGPLFPRTRVSREITSNIFLYVVGRNETEMQKSVALLHLKKKLRWQASLRFRRVAAGTSARQRQAVSIKL